METRTIILLLTGAAVAAAPAGAVVGSIISSFQLTATAQPYAAGIYRDDTYVYGVLYSSGLDYLRTYTVTGSVVGSVYLSGSVIPRDADHSLLGAGYVDILDAGIMQLVTYELDGTWVSNKPLPDGTTAFGYCGNCEYYYTARNGNIYRYTKAGSLMGSFYAGGDIHGLAAVEVFNGLDGEYVVIGRTGGPSITYVYNATGALIYNFVLPGNGTEGSVCGRGEPKEFGRTYWANLYTGAAYWAYQVDIGGTGIDVAPASLGKVKALYR